MNNSPHRILIAPDSFKECLPAAEVARHLEAGFRRALPDAQILSLPLADGGEGTLDVLLSATAGSLIEVPVSDPLGDPITACFATLGDGRTCIIEMARASGLELIPPDRRRAMEAGSRGTGELLRQALDRGCKRVFLAVGGSATTDAGTGALSALGIKFLDSRGNAISPGGRGLLDLCSIDFSEVHPALPDCEIILLCDVDNPLFGPQGAACVYAPQKSASPGEVLLLDQGLRNFASVCEKALGRPLIFPPGAGAAGGIAGSFWALCGARIQKGFQAVSDLLGLEKKLEGVSLVVTGEGSLNYQSAFGKVPGEVAKLAQARRIPAVAVAGVLGEGHQKLYSCGFIRLYELRRENMSIEQSINQAPDLLRQCAEGIAAEITAKRL